jgi:hypothetical protein
LWLPGPACGSPVHWALDDWEQYVYLPDPDVGATINRPSVVAALWTEELDAMRTTRSLCVLTTHPFVSGRPSRLVALERFIDAVEAHGDVAIERADRLADRLLSVATTSLSVSRPA